MTLWTLLSFWILFLSNAPLFALKSFQLYHVQQSSHQYSFDLDFGSFEIKQVQAYHGDQWQSVRLPASVGKNRQPKPEIDFIGDTLEKSILSLLPHSALRLRAGLPFGTVIASEAKQSHKEDFSMRSPRVLASPGTGLPAGLPRAKALAMTKDYPSIFLASLEPVSARKGVRLASGEIWLDKELAVKVTLMESNWSSDPRRWWIAYPARYDPKTKKWDELFAVTDKKFKNKILEIVREAYLERYFN